MLGQAARRSLRTDRVPCVGSSRHLTLRWTTGATCGSTLCLPPPISPSGATMLGQRDRAADSGRSRRRMDASVLRARFARLNLEPGILVSALLGTRDPVRSLTMDCESAPDSLALFYALKLPPDQTEASRPAQFSSPPRRRMVSPIFVIIVFRDNCAVSEPAPGTQRRPDTSEAHHSSVQRPSPAPHPRRHHRAPAVERSRLSPGRRSARQRILPR